MRFSRKKIDDLKGTDKVLYYVFNNDKGNYFIHPCIIMDGNQFAVSNQLQKKDIICIKDTVDEIIYEVKIETVFESEKEAINFIVKDLMVNIQGDIRQAIKLICSKTHRLQELGKWINKSDYNLVTEPGNLDISMDKISLKKKMEKENE